MSPAIAVCSVSKAFRGTPAVLDASLQLWPGQITCLLGPSGCGKSTLLRMIAGLEQPDTGEIEVAGRVVHKDGASVPPEGRGVGLVFQDFALFPHLEAWRNVAFGLRHLPSAERRERALSLLARFKLAHRAEAWPDTLSGGEQQRLAIARALAREPAAVLLDEPFSGLDGDLKAEVRHAVLAGLEASKTAVLIVTHDPKEAMLMGDRLALMSEGRILQTGTPEDCYFRPMSIAAARLLGETNIVEGLVEDGVARTPLGPLPAPDLVAGPVTLMVRPEGVRASPDGRPARVVRVRFGGAFNEVQLDVEGHEVNMVLNGAPPPLGTDLRIGLDPERAALFQP